MGKKQRRRGTPQSGAGAKPQPRTRADSGPAVAASKGHGRGLLVGLALGAVLAGVIAGILHWSPGGGDAQAAIGKAADPAVPFDEAFCGVGGSSSNDIPRTTRSSGTIRMVKRLDRLQREARANPSESAYLSDELVTYCREALEQTTDKQSRIQLRLRLALNLLRSGQSAAALKEFEDAERDAALNAVRLDRRTYGQLRVLRAVCCLRIGEEENCLDQHNSESCLVPISGGGVHRLPAGSRGAIARLEEHLGLDPSDRAAVWLLNVAYMTLGEYPDKVPAAWRVPPEVFESDHDIGRFPDVAATAGLGVDGLAGGVVLEDFNRDGYLDLMVSDWEISGQLRLFYNNLDGTFVERTRWAGLTGLVGGLNLIQADYNNDGWRDVLVLRGAWMGRQGHYPNSLLRNNGDGTFDDVTEEVGLLSLHPTQTAVWLDYDGDGWVDLFIGNESAGAEVHPCELYHNNGDGTFTESGGAAGVGVTGFFKGVAAGDYDNDGRPDLYLSRLDGPNLLFRNEGLVSGPAWRFREVGAAAGVNLSEPSFPAWFFDYDNDGWLDLFVSDYANVDAGDVLSDYLGQWTGGHARLYRNNGDGTFTDRSAAAGLDKILMAMGANYGDLDNDGWLDLFIGNGNPSFETLIPNRMFRNDGGERFQDVTTSGGFGNIQKGHAVGFGDLDNDGDQDVFIKMGGAYSGDTYRSSLFLNPGHGGHWVKLHLEGLSSNRAALGARIRVVVETGEGRERSIYKTVSSGGSFGASPLRQEIGLGQAVSIRGVEVFWPATGQTQQVSGVALDGVYRIREGDAVAVPWDLAPAPIRANPAAGAHPAVPRS